MISERIYRFLLVIYPSEFRREYGELMVQLFRDRMQRDGKGIRGFIVWIQMLNDMLSSALRERVGEVAMTKRKWFGIAFAVLLAAVVVGVGTIYARYGDEEKLTVTVMTDTKTVSGTGSEDFDGAMRQAVEEGAIDQETADKVVDSVEGEGPSDVWRFNVGTVDLADALDQAVEEGKISRSLADEIMGSVEEIGGVAAATLEGVYVLEDVETFTWEGPAGLAEAPRQAEEAETVAMGVGDRILESLEGDDSAGVWRYDGGPEGLAEAVERAVEEGELSRDLADRILGSFDGRRAGG